MMCRTLFIVHRCILYNLEVFKLYKTVFIISCEQIYHDAAMQQGFLNHFIMMMPCQHGVHLLSAKDFALASITAKTNFADTETFVHVFTHDTKTSPL